MAIKSYKLTSYKTNRHGIFLFEQEITVFIVTCSYIIQIKELIEGYYFIKRLPLR